MAGFDHQGKKDKSRTPQPGPVNLVSHFYTEPFWKTMRSHDPMGVAIASVTPRSPNASASLGRLLTRNH
eukprot:6206530-Amphidinium_carterae.1